VSRNPPISYDFHGDLPFSTPFENIKPRDIHIYLDVDTYVGKKTCGQACNHCWFVTYKRVHKRKFEPSEGVAIFHSLRKSGFAVFPRYTDSFAYGGELMRTYGTAHARTYHEGSDEAPTATMEMGEAWTSGRPLLGSDGRALLDIAREHGYRTITITYHGLIDADGNVMGDRTYPIRGVLYGSEFERVIAFIKAYNLELADKFEGFAIGAGVTLGTHNCSRMMLERYAHYFNALGVQRLRFNKFFDHGDRHPHLVLSSQQTREVFENLNWLHDNVAMSFQLGISEDLGTNGISALGLPGHVGWCRAGRQLFAVIPAPHEDHLEGDSAYEKVGDLVGCVNVFEPTVGKLLRRRGTVGETSEYKLEFDIAAINALTKKRLDGTYKDGCFSRELMDELRGHVATLQLSEVEESRERVE
jgi:hypothetical protein